MQFLSDDQAQLLSGGSLRLLLSRAQGQGGRGRLALFLHNSMLAFRAVVTNVNQLNVAVNVALNGGTVINNQANVVAITTSI